MEKKRSIEVTIIAWVSIVIGFIFLFSNNIFPLLYQNIRTDLMGHYPILGLLYLITGPAILRLKRWTRRFNIIVSLCVIVGTILSFCNKWRPVPLCELDIILIYYGPAFFSSLIFLLFFIHPKVKEQFKSLSKSSDNMF